MNIISILLILILTLGSNVVYALEPDTTYIANPDSLQVQVRWQDHKIVTSDSVHIMLRHIEPMVQNEYNDVCIILVGGDRGNLSHYTLHAASLSLAGFQVLCFDYRGFGRSDFYFIDRQFLYLDEFAYDLKAVIEWSKHLHVSRRGLFAFSMGTIPAQQYLWDHSLDFAVFDGLVVNPVTVAHRLSTLQDLDSEYKIEVPASGYHFEKNIKSIKTPVLIFAGKNDPLIPLRDIYRFASKRKKRRKVIDYEGAHALAMQQMTDKYFGDQAIRHLCEMVQRKN